MSLPEYNDEMSKIVWLQPTNKERLKKAIEERDQLLEKYPHLRKTQTYIDEIMSKTPAKDRVEVLFIILGAKLKELNEQMARLKEIKYG